MRRLIAFGILNIVAIGGFVYSDYSSPKLEMPGWLLLMMLLMITGGILEIIPFFKIWGMTNDARKLTNKFCYQSDEMRSEQATKLLYNPTPPKDYELGEYCPRFDKVKIDNKVHRHSDEKILEVFGIGAKALECCGGILDGIHSYPKDALSII